MGKSRNAPHPAARWPLPLHRGIWYKASMGSKQHTKPDDAAQSKRFIEAAREAGADETEEGAERGLAKLDLRHRGRNRSQRNPDEEGSQR